MENIVLKNDLVTATINLDGAELVSVKDNKDNTEYMWQADPEVWKRHAPVLFPIVGKLKDDHFFYNDKEYKMTQHGFARDMTFEIAEQSEGFVSLVLKASSATLAKYPFDFEFYVNYTLNERTVLIEYQTINPVDDDLYFAVGAHPGFSVPLAEGTDYNDYRLELSPKQNRYIIPLDNSNVSPEKRFETDKNTLEISHDLFKDDAIIFELEGSNTISIVSDKTDKAIELSTDNAEFVGLWSTYPTEGKFVCIEPWWGIADPGSSDNQFANKFAIKHLTKKDEEFNATYSITFK